VLFDSITAISVYMETKCSLDMDESSVPLSARMRGATPNTWPRKACTRRCATRTTACASSTKLPQQGRGVLRRPEDIFFGHGCRARDDTGTLPPDAWWRPSADC